MTRSTEFCGGASARAALVCLFLAALGSACASAQTTPNDTTPPPTTERRSDAPPPGSSGSSMERGGSISDQLSRSGGVIRPPADVDPAMKTPAPSTGPNSMPVVPPPGTQGNKPEIQPK